MVVIMSGADVQEAARTISSANKAGELVVFNNFNGNYVDAWSTKIMGTQKTTTCH